MVVLVALAAGCAVLLAVPGRARLQAPGVRLEGVGSAPAPPIGPGRRRLLLAALAGAGGWLFVGGAAGPVAGVLAAAVAWWVLARAEPADQRRAREEAQRDLPHLVRLLAAALRAGSAPGDAVRLVCAALPGPAAQRLSGIPESLALGVDPARVWVALGADEALAPLGRCLARAHETGAPVVAAVERLADELERTTRGQVEDRARAVGVKAALPLGLCLLPSFLLLGIVPLVAGLLAGLAV
ncbi:MAG: type II secretion system F family protein [Marmoricola sp.]